MIPPKKKKNTKKNKNKTKQKTKQKLTTLVDNDKLMHMIANKRLYNLKKEKEERANKISCVNPIEKLFLQQSLSSLSSSSSSSSLTSANDDLRVHASSRIDVRTISDNAVEHVV